MVSAPNQKVLELLVQRLVVRHVEITSSSTYLHSPFLCLGKVRPVFQNNSLDRNPVDRWAGGGLFWSSSGLALLLVRNYANCKGW